MMKFDKHPISINFNEFSILYILYKLAVLQFNKFGKNNNLSTYRYLVKSINASVDLLVKKQNLYGLIDFT